jgi:hypothetical protein
MDSPESEGPSLGQWLRLTDHFFGWCVTVLRPRIDPALAVFFVG